MTGYDDETKNYRFLKFLGAFILIVLVYGGGISKFLGFSGEPAVRQEKLYHSLFEPYWNAVRNGHFSEATEFRSDSWRALNNETHLRQAYQTAQKKHGTLLQPEVRQTRKVSKLNQKDEVLSVETFFQFTGGLSGTVTYTISRSEPGMPWKIEASFPDPGMAVGDGPY